MESTGGKIALGIITIIIIAIIVVVIIMNPGESKKEEEEKNSTNTTSEETAEVTESSNETENVTETTEIDYMSNAEKQMAKPEKGETIAVIHVADFGDITVKFFDDVAPKAVENFTTHAKEGYYDGVTFHRVIDEFMIQGGDPEGTGAGGESIWGEGFEEELDDSIVPYRGSLCMASSGVGTSSLGSQFFITQANPSEEMAQSLSLYGYDEGLIEAYKKYGGYMSLNGQYTVFGQVIDGMDVVDKIAKTPVESNDMGEESSPKDEVVIESIDVTTYQG